MKKYGLPQRLQTQNPLITTVKCCLLLTTFTFTISSKFLLIFILIVWLLIVVIDHGNYIKTSSI